MTPETIALFSQFGFPGMLIGYLIFREQQAAKKSADIERVRAEADKVRAEADKALAGAMSGLSVMVQHLSERLK